ncbi:hypothetical protein H6F89_21970 [Cyanobacteria bacterium FACHB-63]|nr:hypothetical protein [Cyanobacteria bacterium FACHB-63]
MKRLNNQAFYILQTEVRRCLGSHKIGQVQFELALRRLEKLRCRSGTPATEAELRNAIDHLIPNLNPKVLRKAVKANRPSPPLWICLKLAASAISLSASGIWFVNLPIPWLRDSVVQVAPVLLTPSYMAMKDHYRKEIALIEQSEQLVNQATAFTDLDLGLQKVEAAQKHLDELPLSLLRQDSDDDCDEGDCEFTIGEVKAARERVARIQTKLLQEKDAQTRFEQAEQALGESVGMIRNGATGKSRQSAIADWRAAIDTLSQLPASTLAGRLAREKLSAAERDFRTTVEVQAESDRNRRLIEVAQISANVARQQTRNEPMSQIQLSQVQENWESAIAKLQQIQPADPDYVEASRRMTSYQQGLNAIKERIQHEKDSVAAYESAQAMTQRLISNADPNRVDRSYILGQLRAIVDRLDQVKPNTTVYEKAAEMRTSAEKRMLDR